MTRKLVLFAAVSALLMLPAAAQVSGGKPSGIWAGTPGSTVMRSDAEMRQLMAPGMVSPDVAVPLRHAYNALQNKDWAIAIANCQKAQSLAGLAPFDTFMINYFLGIAYYRAGDLVHASDAYFAAAQSSAAPADLRNDAILSGVQIANDAKLRERALTLVAMADTAGIASEKLFGIAAIASYDRNDFAATESWAQKGIAVAKKGGGSASHMTWQMLLLAQSRQKKYAAEIETLESMCPEFGDGKDWGSLIDISFGQMADLKNDAGLETAALYLYRLRLATKAASVADDYVFGAQLALALNSPGDAQAMLAAGTAANLLSGNADAVKAKAEADKRAAADTAALAKAEELAGKAKTGDASVSVGEGYFGYGRYSDAARMATAALAKGGRKTAAARLLLGAAQAMGGDAAAARASLSAVSGDVALTRAARLWSLYASRKPVPAAAVN
jgi:hypothetical protein